MIGRSGERWLRISVLVARHDDDDDTITTIIEHTKVRLSSLTRKFICCYIFKVVIWRKKESMKAELTVLAGQKETKYNNRFDLV